ncbi:MAG TPA: hypothetical protein VFK59_08405 [Actinomycetota bacterium]|nr:hypothetical protein [Actinomycetota bacterium]
MTTTRSLLVRFHARVHGDERGFSLIETVIAAGIIFTALITLAFSATAGFGYQDLARQRQAGTGLANQIMEEIRGLAYERIQAGLLSTDLAGDPNIVDCSGVKRFLSCTVDADEPGTGEAIVSSPGLSTTAPLVPHRGSTTPALDGTTYEWATYVTRDASVVSAPFRVTVIVTWSGGLKGRAPNKLVRVQSLFWSPGGCRNTATHPFAAPCQPFLYGSANVPRSSIFVEGTVDQLSFAHGDLLTPGLSSSVQQEQIQKAQGAWRGAEILLTDTASVETGGAGAAGSTDADSDPGTTTPTYGSYACPGDIVCGAGALDLSASDNAIGFTAPGVTAGIDSAIAAGGASVCPPSPATAETDGLMCSGGSIIQGGSLSATLTLAHDGLAPGAITLAQVAAPAQASTTFVHRNAFPSTTGCSPTSTSDGCTVSTASRSVGTVNVGGLPAGFTPPEGWAGENAWNGYLLSIVGYADTVSASAGTHAPLPTVSQSGTIYYWNGTGYTSVSVTDAALGAMTSCDDAVVTGGPCSEVELTQDFGGRLLTVILSTVPGCCAPGSTSITPAEPSGEATRTDAAAGSVPPTLQMSYELWDGATLIADLTISVNLGTLEARGTYAAAPVEGT